MRISKINLDLVLNSLVETLPDTRTKLFFNIIIETSCKTSELSKIRIKDIYPDKIRFSKRNSPISTELSRLIIKFIKDENLSSDSFLFTTRQSDTISPKRIRQIIHQTSQEKLGSKIDPKDLRKYSIQNKLKTKNVVDVKIEVGLKRLDKRKYLSNKEITELEKNIKDKRTHIIFKLLLSNIKSTQIANLKVEDILSDFIPKHLVKELENYAVSNKVSFGEYLFNTKQNTHLSKVMIFKIIKSLGNNSGIPVNPQILNNTSIANALSSKDSDSNLNSLGVKTRAFHLHGGFIENE